jgi:hypothetical protein
VGLLPGQAAFAASPFAIVIRVTTGSRVGPDLAGHGEHAFPIWLRTVWLCDIQGPTSPISMKACRLSLTSS